MKKVEPKKGEFLIDPTNVPTSFLADVLGVAASYVSTLFSKRVIAQNGKRGRYDLTDAVPMYIQSIRTSGTAEAGEKLKIQQERKLRIQNDQSSGALVKIADAAEVYRQACLSWRAGASALPRRLATELSNTKSAAACRELLVHEIDDLFTEFEKPLREYFGDVWRSDQSATPRDSSVTPVAKKKPRRVGGRKSNPTSRKRGTRKVAK